MSYSYKFSVSYGAQLNRLEHTRSLGAAYGRLIAKWAEAEAMSMRSPDSPDQRRSACLTTLAPLIQFVCDIGATQFARERLNDVLVAFDELHSGRHSVLLSPAPVHPGTLSMTDLSQQAMAQVCVDLLRENGFPAGEARRQTANIFEKHQLPRFGQSKLRQIGSRLTGRGASQDPAYDLYEWATQHARSVRQQLGLEQLSHHRALKLADTLIELTKKRDHRRDFFFAPREDSSPTR